MMLKVDMYVILTFTSYGSDRDTCGGTCRGTGRRRLTRPRMRTPIRMAPIMTTPMRMGGTASTTGNIHRRGMAIISNGNSGLGSCDMIYNDFNLGTGTRNLGSFLSTRNCGTAVTFGTRSTVCHIVIDAFTSEATTTRTHSTFGTGCPGHGSFRNT